LVAAAGVRLLVLTWLILLGALPMALYIVRALFLAAL
jgi:hypothetical protein